MNIFTQSSGKPRFRARSIVGTIATVILGLLLFYAVTISKPDGSITGRSSTASPGCSCHGASPTAATTLNLTSGSGSFSVEPNSLTSFTLTVANPTQVAAGCDIGVFTTSTGSTTVGTLSVAGGSGLQVNGTEVTHTAPKNFTGGSAAFTFSWTAPAAAGVYYIQAAGNAVDLSNTNVGDFWNWLTPVAVTVNGVDLTSPNGSETLCAGGTRNITWTSVGVTNVKIEVSSDGTNYTQLVASTPAAAGSYTWNIPAGQAQTNTYKVRLSDAANPARSDVSAASFTVTSAPTIQTQPTPQTVCLGGAASFTVAVNGPGSTYQWRKGGTNITGATGATLNISAATVADATTYDVVVTNGCGSVTSNTASLTVNSPPVISVHPVTQAVCQGEPVTMSVTATGTSLTYQWFKSGTQVSGATSAALSIPAAAPGDAGQYSVTITGTCNPPATSLAATLVVKGAPTITAQPTAQTICEGKPLHLTVTATGVGLAYQWRKNNLAISGATNAAYDVASAGPGNAGTYDVVISGSCQPSVTSTPVTVTINPLPHITVAPIKQTALVGTDVTFSVTATGPDLQYQWRKSTVNITGATSASLALKSVKATDFGDYDVVVRNSCGADTSAPARLTVNAPGSGPALVFTISPVDFHGVHVGSPVEQNFDGLIRNAGDDTLKVTAMTISGAAASEFAIISGGAPFNIPPNGNRAIKLRFTPATTGLRAAQIDFTSNAKDNPSLTLQGTGSLFGITTTTPAVTFSPTAVGSARDTVIQICNTSTAAETISVVTLQGDPQFSLVPAVITPLNMAPDSCLTISVRYSPTAPGSASGMLVIKNAQGDSIQISLNGTTPGTVSAPRDAASAIFSTNVVPNPTSEQATISVNLVRTSQVDVLVVDERGSVVRRFSRAHAAAGPNTFHWDGKGENGVRVPSGAYQVVVSAGGTVSTLSLVMTR
ncbi:MAG: hypothetical protein JWQ98_2174 [Chlorobi bacterium]|nr:hypothetical protein [Chlorobiota bacterium]